MLCFVLVASHDEDTNALSSFQRLLLHHIDGLILVRSELKNGALIQSLRSSRVPIVGIDRPLSEIGCPSLVCENFEGARMATDSPWDLRKDPFRLVPTTTTIDGIAIDHIQRPTAN